MNPLRTIGRDLVERRLWPLAALLVVGLIAIPVLFLRPAPAALEPTAATPAPAPAPAAGAAATSTPADPADATADPSVGLTSSPFAAAFGGGLNLPPAMEGLLRATKGADARKDVADAPLRDPFAFSGGGAPATASASTAGPADGGSAPAQAAPLTESAPAPSPETAPIPGPEPLPEPAPAPTTPVADDAPAEPVDAEGTTYHADVQFGTVETSPMVSDAQRLTAFPSSFAPVAVYLGVMRGGWGAVFAIRDDARPVGAPSCRPRKQICSWVILHPGEAVTLNVRDEATGAITPYTLKLARITRETLASDAALEANRKADAAGRCLLGPLAAYKYDVQTGTLALRDEMKDCQYRTPDQPETAAVRTYRIG